MRPVVAAGGRERFRWMGGDVCMYGCYGCYGGGGGAALPEHHVPALHRPLCGRRRLQLGQELAARVAAPAVERSRPQVQLQRAQRSGTAARQQ